MAKKPAKDVESLSFEQALEELEATVRQLEDGQLGLAEALACYEGGVKHLKHCYTLLRKAERRIELVRGVDEAGNLRTEQLDDEAMSLEEKAEAGRSAQRGGARRTKTPRRPTGGERNQIDSPERLF